jgi:hypothetical protein
MPINLGNGLVTGNINLRAGSGGGGGGGATVNVPAHSILFSSSGTDICGNTAFEYNNSSINLNNVSYKTRIDTSDNLALFIITDDTNQTDIVIGNSIKFVSGGNSSGNNVIIGNSNIKNFANNITNMMLIGYNNYNVSNPMNNILTFGSNNEGNNDDIIIGNENESDGTNIILGSNNLGSYNNGIIVGNANIKGDVCIIFGSNNQCFDYCTIVGSSNQSTNNNNIFGTNNSIIGPVNCTIIGNSTGGVTGDNQIQLGDSSTTVYYYNIATRSDIRDKTDIEDIPIGLNFINKLKPKFFKWNYREDYLCRDTSGQIIYDQSKNPIYFEQDGTKKRYRPHAGLIAQDVKQAMDDSSIDFGIYQDHTVNGGKDVKTLSYMELIPVLIKAVQDLSAKNDALEARIKILENKN